MSIHESGEMYLENIYLLLRDSNRVRAVDVSDRTGYKKSSVSRALAILKKSGHIETDDEGYISLTQSGRDLAEKTYERHSVLTQYFISLGVTEQVAAADACRIEHVISDETFYAMKRQLVK